MIPTTREIAMQIALMHERYPKDSISKLAERLMYSPVFVINALDEGERIGLFVRRRKADKLTGKDLDYSTMTGSEFGEENKRIQNEIRRTIASANADEMDVESGTLDLWTRGIRPSEVEIALHLLEKTGEISTYTLTDPKDKKSKYTFYTLSINAGKEWGLKQFKKSTK